MAKFWQNSVNRFCAQYLQIEESLEFPDGDILKLEDVQACLYERLFADDVVYQPHVKYQISALKRITSLIESSIDDWDQYVSCRGQTLPEHLHTSLVERYLTVIFGATAGHFRRFDDGSVVGSR